MRNDLQFSARNGLIAAPGQIAQSVEQWTENPRVGSSNLPLAKTQPSDIPITQQPYHQCNRRGMYAEDCAVNPVNTTTTI